MSEGHSRVQVQVVSTYRFPARNATLVILYRDSWHYLTVHPGKDVLVGADGHVWGVMGVAMHRENLTWERPLELEVLVPEDLQRPFVEGEVLFLHQQSHFVAGRSNF